MEWIPWIILAVVVVIVKLSGNDADKVAADLGKRVANISTVVEKYTMSFKEEREKLKSQVSEVTEPINQIKKEVNDTKETLKGEF